MPVRHAPCSGLSTRVNARWQSLLQFSGIPEPGDFDRFLEESETLMVQRIPDRRPFRAMIECVQNLQRHSDPNAPVELRLLGRCIAGEPRFLIRTVNGLKDADVKRVREWVGLHEEWQRSVADAPDGGRLPLRELHRKMLETGERTPRGGAGLGWMSMARFAKGMPVIRLIEGQDVNRLFFSLEVACCS